MRQRSAMRAVRRLAALALCSASCATPTMTVDVVEAPELVDGLTGTLVYVERQQSMAATEYPGWSKVVLVDVRSGTSVPRPLPDGRPNISLIREDGTLRFASESMGERGVYSVIDGTIVLDDFGVDPWIELDAWNSTILFAPCGEGVLVHNPISERPATSSEPKRETDDRVLVRIGDRTHVRSGTGSIAWSPDGDRLLYHARDGLFEYRAHGEPAVRRIADHTDEPVAIGYFEGEPCMALSEKWPLEIEHQLPDWPLRTLELPGLYATSFDQVAPGLVLYESVLTAGKVVRRAAFTLAGNTWFSTLRVCEPATSRTLVVNDRYDDYYGPFLVGYSDTTIAELGLAD
jgi:hypothetical protein